MSDRQRARSAQGGSGLLNYLAGHRTSLANERTRLAYIRTGLTTFVAGVSFVRFFDHPLIEAIGWAFVPLGVATFLLGLARYKRIREELTLDVESRGSSGPASQGPLAH
jgi:putative membrane protein